MIPMVDLKSQYQRLKAEINRGIQEVLESTQFILGPNVQAFEQEAAQYLGAKYAVGCASGTDALHLALRAVGVGEGDEVITSPFTFVATAEAISYVGASAVFVDIEPDTFNIDTQQIEAAITDRTRALLPVHLFGQPADMGTIMTLAEKHRLQVIEDCAQSFGAAVDGTMTGSIGGAAAHSFFPSKNLGCYGDGGMVTTNDKAIEEQVRVLCNHGSRERYRHSTVGYNSRLDELQAAVLRVKLKHIDEFNRERQRVAHSYSEKLSGVVTTPYESTESGHIYHQYTLLSDRREAIMQALQEQDIASAIYYPIPLHKQEAFAEQFQGLSLPVSEMVASQCLSIPMYPEMGEEEIETVASAIKLAG